MAIITPPLVPNQIWNGGAAGPFNPSSIPFTNPSTAALRYIGPVTTEWEADIPVWETPFALDPKPYIYHQLYNVKASAFQSMALYAAGPYGGMNCGESNFRTSKGGILSFYREFARKPDSRNEFESYIYPYQILTYGSVTGFSPSTPPYTTIGVSDASITEVPVRVSSRIQYDYFETLQPESIPLPKAPRALVIGTNGYMIHGWGTLTAGDQMLAEDATLQIWRGKIYERKMRFVEVQKLGELL